MNFNVNESRNLAEKGLIVADEKSFTGETPAHLAFRRIIVHEFSDGAEPQKVGFHFHYRNHSKHISGRHSA